MTEAILIWSEQPAAKTLVCAPRCFHHHIAAGFCLWNWFVRPLRRDNSTQQTAFLKEEAANITLHKWDLDLSFPGWAHTGAGLDESS